MKDVTLGSVPAHIDVPGEDTGSGHQPQEPGSFCTWTGFCAGNTNIPLTALPRPRHFLHSGWGMGES